MFWGNERRKECYSCLTNGSRNTPGISRAAVTNISLYALTPGSASLTSRTYSHSHSDLGRATAPWWYPLWGLTHRRKEQTAALFLGHGIKPASPQELLTMPMYLTTATTSFSKDTNYRKLPLKCKCYLGSLKHYPIINSIINNSA